MFIHKNKSCNTLSLVEIYQDLHLVVKLINLCFPLPVMFSTTGLLSHVSPMNIIKRQYIINTVLENIFKSYTCYVSKRKTKLCKLYLMNFFKERMFLFMGKVYFLIYFSHFTSSKLFMDYLTLT